MGADCHDNRKHKAYLQHASARRIIDVGILGHALLLLLPLNYGISGAQTDDEVPKTARNHATRLLGFKQSSP